MTEKSESVTKRGGFWLTLAVAFPLGLVFVEAGFYGLAMAVAVLWFIVQLTGVPGDV